LKFMIILPLFIAALAAQSRSRLAASAEIQKSSDVMGLFQPFSVEIASVAPPA